MNRRGVICEGRIMVALFHGTKMMQPTKVSCLLLPLLIALSSASICERGKQYLDHNLQRCVNCTICDNSKDMVVMRPCEVHQDTLCAPFSQFSDLIMSGHRHRHGHTSREDRHKHEEIAQGLVASQVPFSNVETIIWDWQAIALSLAVFSCIAFFLIISIYSLHQARQWRRLKENFEADVEELSVRLSLMAANCSEKGETLEPNFVHEIRDGNYHKNKCVYLEQLLNVRKDQQKLGNGKATGNVYIEDGNPSQTVNAGKT